MVSYALIHSTHKNVLLCLGHPLVFIQLRNGGWLVQNKNNAVKRFVGDICISFYFVILVLSLWYQYLERTVPHSLDVQLKPHVEELWFVKITRLAVVVLIGTSCHSHSLHTSHNSPQWATAIQHNLSAHLLNESFQFCWASLTLNSLCGSAACVLSFFFSWVHSIQELCGSKTHAEHTA